MGYKNSDPCIQKAYDDERLFVLMARDLNAPAVVVEWIKMSIGTQPKDKLHEALDAAIEMHETQQHFLSRKSYDALNEKMKSANDNERKSFEFPDKIKDALGKNPFECFSMYYKETKRKLSTGCGSCYNTLRNWMNS